ncbi:BTB/POZ domain-containing protein 6-like [Coccinella septempunctata]|uniref:BTB/POZ domain-containing protein 6-like n=1 Tax=Coccinella septempunctata TaxID=41139 RepID=UPI001D07E772|nr:BTB/POZ domain-containing protein 6-like [Coccinella septempunctata]
MSVPPPPACDWQTTKKQIKERGQHLLETGMWSDCRFIVGTEPNQQVLEGHKLFLAMSSPVFEAMFYGGMAEKDPIAILDVQPDAFRALLEYVYTDTINLTSFDQACELCYGAKKYMLPHLVEECTKYLWSDLYPKNACRAYEFAKLFEEPILMDKCLNIICNQTQEVLSESSFEEAELNTIITIFEQDELNIESELDLFSALQRYAVRHNLTIESVSNNNSSNRLTYRDALMKIRFLTLTPQQFAEGPANSQLLAQSEKFSILMNICSPSAANPMPEGFSLSKSTRKRKQQLNMRHGLYLAGPSNMEMDTSRTSMIIFPSSNVESGSESLKKYYCSRQLLRITECMNTSVLDCALTFRCDKNIGIYGIEVPAQIPMKDNDRQQQNCGYTELLYAHLLDADGSRLTYTHFTSRVEYNSIIEIFFNRPIYIQKNKIYKVGVVLNKIGCYPIGTHPITSMSNGVVFTFSEGLSVGDNARDGLIRSIIFSMSNPNNVTYRPSYQKNIL